MNAFANALFTLLLGWARSLLYSLSSMLSSDSSRNALSWLGDHWLALAAGLALLGTAADFVVWLVRWQPYRVWRTHLRKFARRIRGQSIQDKRFEKGYRDGVVIDRPETAAPAAQEAPRFTRAGEEPYAPIPTENQPVWTRIVSSAPPQGAPAVQTPLQQMMFEEEFSSRPQPVLRQKRRSDKYRQGLAGAVYAVRNRLNDTEEEEGEMLSGLPPVVDKEQAFRQPVYPKYNDGKGAP